MGEQEEEIEVEDPAALLAALEEQEVVASKGHNCKICEKPPRKNQLILHCSKCYDTYFKTCPVLLSKEIKDYDTLFRTWLKNKESWDCLECRKKLKTIYCTVCHMDKDKILLDCTWCKSKCHSDCAGNVKLGLIESANDWLCRKCSGDKRTDWDTNNGISNVNKDRTPGTLVGIKELEDQLKTEFYPYEGVKILQLNISAQRLHKIKHFLIKNEKFVDVFAIGETGLTKNHSNVEYEVPNYEMIRCDKKVLPPAAAALRARRTSNAINDEIYGHGPGIGSNNHRTGGLLFYIRKDWRIVSKSSDYFENKQKETVTTSSGTTENTADIFEYFEIKIEKENARLKGDSLTLILLFVFSPESNNQSFMEKLEDLLQNRIIKLKHVNQVFILGDIKINLIKNANTRLGVNFKTLMTELGFRLLLDEEEPTKASKKTAKLTHVLYANEDVEEQGVRGGVVYLDWSSHYLVYCVKKYYFKSIPTLEAKTLKAFGFTNLSEHTTTKKERVIKAILEYAKIQKNILDNEIALKKEKESAKKIQFNTSSLSSGGAATAAALNGKMSSLNGNLTKNSLENENEITTTASEEKSGSTTSLPGILKKVNSTKEDKVNNNIQKNGKSLLEKIKASNEPKKKKRFWFVPVWCSSISATEI